MPTEYRLTGMEMEPGQIPDFRDRTLLVITPDFPDEKNRYIGGVFVKNQLEVIRRQFRKVVVVAPVPLSFGRVSSDRLCRDYAYDNVSVYYPRALFVPRRLRLPVLDDRKLSLDLRLRAVAALIEREGIDFDLVHAHFTWPSGGIARMLKEKYGVPVVLTVHEDPGWLAEEASSRNPEFTAAWRIADVIIRVTSKDSQLIAPFNPRVTVIPNGYSPEFHPRDRRDVRRQLGFGEERKVLFSLGYLVEQKGFIHLIRAIRQLCNERGDIDCYIGGTGPLRDDLQREINGSSLRDRVKLLGFINADLVPIWMSAADLFVLPSLSESFGIVQVEAMACGTPVIATRNGGSEEVVAPEITGLLCRPADSGELALAIRDGLDRTWDRDKVALYAQRFSWERISARILELYRSVLLT